MRIATVLGVAVFMLSMLDPQRARAQTFEVGAGIAVSCHTIEQSLCSDEWGRTDAVHVAWWASPSIVVEARVARLDGPDTRVVAIPERITGRDTFYRSYTLRDERRTVLQASVLYHFLPGRPVRPFVGGGVGALWWRGEAFCDRGQIDCQRVLPPEAPGPLRAREFVTSIAFGAAVDAGYGLIVRGGVRDASIPSSMWDRSEENSRRALRGQLPEFFLSVGYRF
jgi:hypothetical protein